MDKTKKKKIIKRILIALIILVVVGFIIYAALIAVGVFWMASVMSDHTELTGDIVLLKDNLKVNDEIPMILVVPDELDDIHMVDWGATHSSDENFDPDLIIYGEQLLVTYSENQLKKIFNIEEINYDRIAIFKPDKSGKYTIDLFGFYKQTNPQGITYIEVEVND